MHEARAREHSPRMSTTTSAVGSDLGHRADLDMMGRVLPECGSAWASGKADNAALTSGATPSMLGMVG
jgi:hypothetical protein